MTHRELDADICGFDDLSIVVKDTAASLDCPRCGPIAVPLRAPTLSDFTNAALMHLAEVHAVRRGVGTDLASAA